MGTPTKVRRARGERRRRELLEAALAVIDARGAQATTHRAIAEAAGVPLATTTYYFESIDQLLEEALLLFASEEAHRLGALAARLRGVIASAHEIADQFARELVEGSPWRVPLRRVQWELYLEASRRPRLQAAAQRCVETYRAVAEAALAAAGSPRPAEGARLFVALADGLGIQDTFAPEGQRRTAAQLADALRELFVPFAMARGEREAWAQRLREPRGADRLGAADAGGARTGADASPDRRAP